MLIGLYADPVVFDEQRANQTTDDQPNHITDGQPTNQPDERPRDLGVGKEREKREALFPRGKKSYLCFAGEGTTFQSVGTVHGAYYSGEREAHRILNYYNTK